MIKQSGSAQRRVIAIAAVLLTFAVSAGAGAMLLHRKNQTIARLNRMLTVQETFAEVSAEDSFEPVEVDHHYPLAGYKILLKDETFGQIWIPVLEDVKLSEHPLELLTQEGERMYSHDREGRLNAVTGIDISAHNTVTDWEAVKADGIDFVMLRVGLRTYGGGLLREDEKFKEYYEGAKAAGLKVGAYFFSQAVTEEEAVEEAALTAKMLNGCELDFPVAFDWEIIFDDTDGARTDNVPVDTLTDLTLAFCQNIENLGYQPMIYQNKRTSLLKYDLPRLQGIPFWLAEYGDGATYIYNYDMWQYSCKNTVAGIEDKVDMNLCFLDYSAEGNPPFAIDDPDYKPQETDTTGTTDTTETTETTDTTEESTETELTVTDERE